MNCGEWLDKLYQILDRDLDETMWRDLESHMKSCRSCWDRFEFEKQIKARVKESCVQESCAETLRIRIKALFKKY